MSICMKFNRQLLGDYVQPSNDQTWVEELLSTVFQRMSDHPTVVHSRGAIDDDVTLLISHIQIWSDLARLVNRGGELGSPPPVRADFTPLCSRRTGG